MPSPVSYQASLPAAGSFSIAPPRNPPKPVAPPLTPATRHLSVPSSQMPVFPAHRKGTLPLSKSRGSSPSPRHGSPINGPRVTLSPSHSHSKRKTLTTTSKDASKRRSPLVVDRKQAVYGSPHSKSASSQSRQRSSSEYNLKGGNVAEKRSSSVTKGDKHVQLSNSKNLKTTGNINEVGIFEPVIVRGGEIKRPGEPKRLEKDLEGRLYKVVQTKLVEGDVKSSNGTSDFFSKRLSLPIVKSNTESSMPRQKETNHGLLNLFTNSTKALILDMGGGAGDPPEPYKDLSNKENIAKNLNTSSPHISDRSNQEAIDRIKKSIERKEAFLKRPNEPIWNSPLDEFPAPREHLGNSQTKPTQAPSTEGALTRAIAYLMGHRGDNQVLRRVKSEAEGPRTVSFPSTDSHSLEQFRGETPLTLDARSNSLPSSPIATLQEPGSQQPHPHSPSNTPLYSSLLAPLSPLTGNIVAKPYGTHLAEDGVAVAAKFARPFVSTLSRIHENIPSASQGGSSASSQPGVAVVPSVATTSPTTSVSSSCQTSSAALHPVSTSSVAAVAASNIIRTVPILWVGDNERIKQLQIVSTRAKKFESMEAEREAKRSALHRFELSRLSQRANAIKVADRKKEFEKRGANDGPNRNSGQGVSYELGTSFDCSSRLKKMEDAYWRGSKGVVKSLSDGGNFFVTSKQYCSLPEEPCNTGITMSSGFSLNQGTGNRMIPIGGTKIHCEPPASQRFEYDLPENDSELLERNRANSTSSHDALWPCSAEDDAPRRKRAPPLVRQHSFHSTLQSHLALAGVPEPEVAEASLCSGGLIPASESPKAEGVAGWGHPSGPPSGPLRRKPERPSFLPIESHARPSEEGLRPPQSRCCMPPSLPHDQGAVSSIQQRIASASDGSSGAAAAVSTSGTQSAAGVAKRNKHLYGEEHDRLVRRVSYLKATTGDRIDSEESEDEKPSSATSPESLVRRVIGEPSLSEDLPSPASFLSSVTSSGLLHVKLAKLHGKRAGDRSWKSSWAVIRGTALLLYKDKNHAAQTPFSPEDSVSLRGADAGVASDYTKRRHVLRLTTPASSQFLLQAESEPAMTAWLNSITAAASHDVEPHLKAMTPTPDNDSLTSPHLDAAAVTVFTATTPTSAPSGSVYVAELPVSAASEGNVSPQAVPKNKKITSPLKAKAPVGLAMQAKSRKSGEMGSSPKSKTWKGRLGRQLRKMQGSTPQNPPTAPLPQGASIGVALEDCPLSTENEFVPLLVALCVGVVESKGLHIQGIYRIPGNRAAVTHLIEVVNRGPKALDLTDTRWSDVNVISSLLKQFFQRLQDPLIPSDLYQHFIEASRLEDPQQRLIELKNLVQELPDYHYETLRFLCFHLSHVTSKASVNKMDVRNLAIVFGPTLIRAADDNMAKMVTDMSHQCRIVEMLISQVNWFFNDEESEDPPPIITSGAKNSLSGENAANASEMEPSSQSLLLGNVQKLEASQKDPKKLLVVSSIISAANRRVQKVRRRAEEDGISGVQEHSSSQTGSQDGMMGYLQDEFPDGGDAPQRRVSDSSGKETMLPVTATSFYRSSHRDARFFSDSCTNDSLLSKDDRIEYVSSLTSLTTPPTYSASNSGVGMKNADVHGGDLRIPSSLSRSEPSYVGEDLAFQSYAGLSASTQERIRRFEMETKAMLQRDVSRHRREMPDKRKIEEELQKAKQDLETEDIFDRIADNPSEVVHMISDYAWPSSRGTSPSSFRSSAAPSDPLKSHLAKSSLLPSNGITNASAKSDKLNQSEIGANHQRPNHEGSDLLNAINATFEKMKSSQDSLLLPAESDCSTRRDHGSTGSSHIVQVHCEEATASNNNNSSSSHSTSSSNSNGRNSGSAGTKCKLYRDPSLHRRRTFNTAIKHSPSSEAISSSHLDTKEESESTLEECISMGVESEGGGKEKSEKRTRDLMRTETQESLREKKPKELKRSDTKDSYRDPRLGPLGLSAAPPVRKERRDPSSKVPSDLRSRKHNVRELKERFERSSPPISPVAAASSPLSKSPTAQVAEKPSRAALKQARKARIKRRHTVGGMKDLARVAWLKVIEAAHYADPQKVSQVSSQSTAQRPSWEQLQMFLEALAEGRKANVEAQSLNAWVAREKLGSSSPDLDSILSLVLPPQQKEALKRRLSVREPSMKPLHPVLESNV